MKQMILPVFLALNIITSSAKDDKISSPDNRIVINVSVGPEIRWSASYDNREIINTLKTALVLGDGGILGVNETVNKHIIITQWFSVPSLCNSV